MSDAFIEQDTDINLELAVRVINMLMAEYDYETDIAVQREEVAENATKEAAKAAQIEADRKFLEHINKLMKKMNLSAEEACQVLE